MFNEAEQKAIGEKIEQLRKIRDGSASAKDLGDSITKRRVSWFERNRDILSKYSGMPDEKKAYMIIYFDHMRINPDYIQMFRIGERKIRIEARNFCPYLEACKMLGLDTRYICKEVGEPSIQKICEMINPKLKFSRNYQNVRPYSDFCEEYFEIL